jgi:hypothetical protein
LVHFKQTVTFLFGFLVVLQGLVHPSFGYRAGTACGRFVAGWNTDYTEAILITLPQAVRSLPRRPLPIGESSSVRVRVVDPEGGFRRCGEDLGVSSFVEVLSEAPGWIALRGSVRVSVTGRSPFGSATIELRDMTLVDGAGNRIRPRQPVRFTAQINETLAG